MEEEQREQLQRPNKRMKHELVFVFGDRNVIIRTDDLADIAGQGWFREFVGLAQTKGELSEETLEELDNFEQEEQEEQLRKEQEQQQQQQPQFPPMSREQQQKQFQGLGRQPW